MQTRILWLAFVPLTLSGCFSGSDSSAQPDPMARYSQQTLNWQACNADTIQFDSPETTQQAIDELGERLQCAMMTVPMDYNDINKADLLIAVSRTRAATPSQRMGSLFFNPGGPGGDGLAFGAKFGQLWQGANPDNPIGQQLKMLNDRFDLIGFSPRGTGSSTHFTCSGNERWKPTSTHTDNEQNTQNLLYNAELIARTCLKNPMARYINTENTVRDMDLLRQLLGDDQLNYFGYSYGTWLGSWYASRFPQHTGRMLLDSNMNFTSTFDEASIRNAAGRQRLIDDYWAPFAAEHHEDFLLGDTVDAVRNVFPNLSIAMQDALSDQIGAVIGRSQAALSNLHSLRTAQVLDRMMLQNPDIELNLLREQVETTEFFPNADTNDQAKKIANGLIDRLYNRPPPSIYLQAGDGTNAAVTCNDTPSQTDPLFWTNLGQQQLRDFLFSGNKVAQQPCLYWGGPSVSKPDINAANTTQAGLLMLHSEYDPLTPIEGAKAAFSKLTHARFITVNNEFQHGLFPYGTECVDLAVTRYLIDGVLPDALMQTCEGKGWAAIVQNDSTTENTASARTMSANSSRTNVPSSEIYLDPERAQKLLNSIKTQIGSNTLTHVQ